MCPPGCAFGVFDRSHSERPVKVGVVEDILKNFEIIDVFDFYVDCASI